MVGVIADIEVGTGIDASVVVEEGFVAAQSVAACAVSEVVALETGGVAGQTEGLVNRGSAEQRSGVLVGGLRANLVAEVVHRVQVVGRVVADHAESC
jgi:hypothetical protein